MQRQLALRTEFGARDVERAATQVQILASQTQRFVDPQPRTGDEANKDLQRLRAECRAVRTHFPRTTHDQPDLGGCHNIGCAAPADTAAQSGRWNLGTRVERVTESREGAQRIQSIGPGYRAQPPALGNPLKRQCCSNRPARCGAFGIAREIPQHILFRMHPIATGASMRQVLPGQRLQAE